MAGNKKTIGVNVLDAARHRIAWVFDEFQRIYVSFSGGKDSTVMLHLVMDEAIKRGRKVGVLFVDMEGQYKLTIDHIQSMYDLYAALTDPVTWEAVQRINTARRERHPGHHPRQVNSRFWLSGLLVCANCGANLVGQSYTANGKRYDYYVCSRRLSSLGLCSAAWVRKTSIEDRVILVLQETILQPAILADLVAEARTVAGGLQAEQETRQAQTTEKLTQVRAEIGRVVAAITAAGHSPALLEHLARLEDEQRSLLEAASANAETTPPIEIDPYAFSQSALEVLAHGEDGDRAQISRGLIQRIIVTPRPLSLEVQSTLGGPVRSLSG